MEIGSFIEMEFKKGREYYTGNNVARLNSGRAGIFHAVSIFKCKTVYLPYYQCDTVRNFLLRKGLDVRYYSIDSDFNPKIDKIPEDAAIVIVNYFGIMSRQRMMNLAKNFKNVVIDNSQAFFCEPIENCMNVYSTRKFFGVPDGAYVVGKDAKNGEENYKQDFSSDTSLFLLQRIEYGCEGISYESRMQNEKRIDDSDIKRMSKLTHTILDGADYDYIAGKRKENFETASMLFNDINKIDAKKYFDFNCIPMVYPLVVENDGLLKTLLDEKIFQGHWWSYLLNEVDSDSFEYWISRYVIPITIDQRYGREELQKTFETVEKFMGENE